MFFRIIEVVLRVAFIFVVALYISVKFLWEPYAIVNEKQITALEDTVASLRQELQKGSSQIEAANKQQKKEKKRGSTKSIRRKIAATQVEQSSVENSLTLGRKRDIALVENLIAFLQDKSVPSLLGYEHAVFKGETMYRVNGGEGIYAIAGKLSKKGIWVRPDQIMFHNDGRMKFDSGERVKVPIYQWQPHLVEASWYGPGFDGKPMANTEIFDENDPTLAAHMSLPLGMEVKVTNLANNKTIIVRITDRGDFAKYERGIDLSRAAAEELGYRTQGTTPVLVEPVYNEAVAIPQIIALR